MILSKGVPITRDFLDREEFNLWAIIISFCYIVDMTYYIIGDALNYVIITMFVVLFIYCLSGFV